MAAAIPPERASRARLRLRGPAGSWRERGSRLARPDAAGGEARSPGRSQAPAPPTNRIGERTRRPALRTRRARGICASAELGERAARRARDEQRLAGDGGLDGEDLRFTCDE